MAEEIPMDRRAFERALRELQQQVKASSENPGAYRSDNCVRCYHCMFTTKSEDCFHCTYCTECVECSQCTHCRSCRSCHESSYCVNSQNCSKCSYLILCENCSECVFCFGCVGLVKKEFHILNQPFRRDEYFRMLEKLKKAFGIA